ncbi:MAG: NAD(P)/FAD-dependent oxidoreductase [Cyanobacteria bacterium SZAS LIN-3]|nr:NAD(P)/FAD-dependent oxidoreductase [Cyanobacteria bacterium SZAS LIN-3]
MSTEKKIARVVIIGGGFAGLNCAKALQKAAVEITIVDRKNHHLFQPLLYQVATATLAPSNIAQPIRSILRDYENVRVILDEVTGFDLQASRVQLGSGTTIEYDYLVVASGSTHSYFGHNEWERFAPGLKTVEDAIEIRKQIFLAFERAERQMLDHGSHDPLVFVVIGGGPTGVELAGAIADTAKIFLRKDYRLCKPCDARILLIESLDKILGPYPQKLSESALEQLQELGVEVLLGTKVEDVQDHCVITDKGRYDASVIIWAAGVAASPLGKMLGEVDRRGCVMVDQYLNPRSPHPTKNIYVLGDLAHFEQDGKQVPGVAQTAIQMGNYTARAIACDLRGEQRPQFRYFDKGEMATIGRAKAVAQLKWPFKADLTGLPAWLSWLLIHILFLVGLKNRLIVLLQWMWTFFSKRWGVGLITFEGNVKPEDRDR